ncbi:MAG: ribonuclease PH [Gemmatimonadetes bacterium]|nr:ribonuclease PH [Gemmatimonadota bacterium]|tara:strand:- start:467 stop:1189 length:723 start_codon:yes stop_codon:yes gene_type:complete
MARIDGREPDQLRPVTITPGYMKHAEGSVLIEMGDTHVICSVSVEDRVPHFLIGKGQGWITAEYSMLPRSTHTRTQRETRGVKGRTQEIQRLIGRAIRGISNLKNVGERTLWIDCDVIRADGGTRTASITGAYIAVALALDTLKQKDKLKGDVLRDSLAAISVGIVDGTPCLDLCYQEDSSAEVDMNVVMTGDGRFVELQGTAEGEPFDADQMQALVGLATKGINELTVIQNSTIAEATA